MRKYFLLFGVASLLFGFVACDKMNDVHEKYTHEQIYSGKINNVRSYPGIEKVYLAWDNPADRKSHKIYIEYFAYEDSLETYLNDQVFNGSRITLDSLIIDSLVYDAAYTFRLYTLDAYDNKSIPVEIMVTPITQAKCDGLIGPSVDFTYDKAKGDSIVKFKIDNLTNDTYAVWAGGISYKLTNANGDVLAEGEEHGLPTDSTWVKNPGTIREEIVTTEIIDYYFSVKIPENGTYFVDYGVWSRPLANGEAVVDTCIISGQQNLTIEVGTAE
mgnify:CR=1 FL=1